MALTLRKLAGLLLVALVFMAFRLRQPALRQALDPRSGVLLTPLLEPRVAGTEGGARARRHIVDQLTNFGWQVQLHDFSATTPHGTVPMSNILARRTADLSAGSKPKLTLAAHYDSKALPEGFIGATDSAFPCALMLWLASLKKRKPKYNFDLIFFDGEEAFVNWSAEDSIYGARALAELQSQQGTLPSTLVLLDLLGSEARFPIPSWFAETKHLHAELSKINPKLVGGRELHHYAGMIEDDHIPYMRRGVPVLHLIPQNFPEVWHTLKDDVDALHWESMEAWAELMEKWLFE